MIARLEYACQPAAPGTEFNIETIHVEMELPFVPVVGMKIRPTSDSDYIEIADVLLDFCPGGEGLVVCLEEPPVEALRPWSDMEAQGWQLTNPD